MPTMIPAAAEGMPTFNRRKAMTLTGIAAVAAVILPASAAVATAEPEHPWVKARRLAKELAVVLDEGDCDIWDGPCGEWYAEVYPSKSKKYPIGFGSIDAREGNPTVTQVFALWLEAYNFSYQGLSEEKAAVPLAEYQRLQELVTSLKPVTACDLAMQIIAETDNGDSEWRDRFEDHIRRLAGGVPRHVWRTGDAEDIA